MNKILRGFTVVLAGFCALLGTSGTVFAEDEGSGEAKPATSISISPVNKVVKLEPGKTYDDSFKVMNNAEIMELIDVYIRDFESKEVKDSDNR